MALIKFFTPHMWHLFKGDAYLRMGFTQKMNVTKVFSFNSKEHFQSVRKSICTSNWEKEEPSYSCCSRKVFGLHNRIL